MLGVWPRSLARPSATILGLNTRHLHASCRAPIPLVPQWRASTRGSVILRPPCRWSSTSTPPSSSSSSSKVDFVKHAKPTVTPSFLSRLLHAPSQVFGKTAASDGTSSSSFAKILALAKPERKPLLIAIGLLFVSSAVSMSVPFTIGKLIDFFCSPNPVSSKLCFAVVPSSYFKSRLFPLDYHSGKHPERSYSSLLLVPWPTRVAPS